MERGNQIQRRLDSGIGIPLIFLAGCAARVRRLFAPTGFDPATARKVGILCLGAVGDLLLATGLLEGLRRALPTASVEIITSKANVAVRDLLPEGYEASAFGIKDIFGITSHLRGARYDILIDTGQWARIGALASAVSGAKCTVGFKTAGQHRHYALDRSALHRNDAHEVENFLALGRTLFPDLDGTPVIRVPQASSAACLALPDSGVVFCHMWPSGLKSHLKEWPLEYWADLALRLLNAGYTPVFTGGPEDGEATDSFLEEHVRPHTRGERNAVSVAGKMSLPDLACVMRGAAAVVSVNTGTMHLAALAGAPTIGLHGPTNPMRWGPVGPKTQSLVPETGHCAYLDLGFEYPENAEPVLRHLSVSTVCEALRRFGLSLS